MQKTSPLALLILSIGILLGAYARFLPAILTGFPVTDGGLFLRMVAALQDSHYTLPAFVEYNGWQIPFAYPPLGFYLAALTADLTRLPLLEIFRWLPAALSVTNLLAFYPLAAALLRSPLKGSLATAFYALLPRSVGWFVMGGGITRAAGQTFLLLTLFAAYQLLTASEIKYRWLAIFFGAGAVLSHPESALHTAALSATLWLFFGRSKQGTKEALAVSAGVALLTAPFFGTVIARHGIAPYQNAMNASLHNWTAWLGLLSGGFADEKFITVLSALALLGLARSLWRREWLLPLWWLLPALLDSRGAASIAIIAWALMAALAFSEVILPGLGLRADKEETLMRASLFRLILPALMFYSFIGVTASAQVYRKFSVTPAERAALEWTAERLPSGGRFALVSGGGLAFSDALAEWFPALTPHISLATPQGAEWLNDKPFAQRMSEYDTLQACLYQSAECVEGWQPDYIWTKNDSPLANSLRENAQPLYEKDGIVIFSWKR